MRATKTKAKAVCYSRYSSDQQNASSIDRQETLAKNWAEHMGVEIVKFFRDEAVSGKAGKNLDHDLGRCIDFIKSQKDIAYIAVEDPDRLSRESPLVFVSKFAQILVESKISIVQTSSGTIFDPSHGMDFIGLMMKTYLANEENVKKKERVTESYERRFKKGVACPKITFGYKKNKDGKIVVHDENAAIVKEVFELCASGMSYNLIAKTLNKDKTVFPGANKAKNSSFGDGWTTQTVRRALLSLTYYDGSQMTKRGIVPNVYIPIIDTDLWRKSRQKIAAISRVPNISEKFNMGKQNNLFSDLIYCAECGSKYHIRSHRKAEFKSYVCSGNVVGRCQNKFNFHVQEFESIVLTRLIEFIDTGEFGKLIETLETRHKQSIEIMNNEKQKLEKSLEQSKKVLDGLIEKYAVATGKLAETMLDNLNRKQNDVTEIEQALKEVSNQLNYTKANSGTAVMEISKDIKSLKNAISKGWAEYDVRVSRDAFAKLQSGEVSQKEMDENFRQAIADIPEKARLQLKSALHDLIERIDIHAAGRCDIKLKTDRIDTLDLCNALSHCVF